jgi:hypothetical protein
MKLSSAYYRMRIYNKNTTLLMETNLNPDNSYGELENDSHWGQFVILDDNLEEKVGFQRRITISHVRTQKGVQLQKSNLYSIHENELYDYSEPHTCINIREDIDVVVEPPSNKKSLKEKYENILFCFGCCLIGYTTALSLHIFSIYDKYHNN